MGKSGPVFSLLAQPQVKLVAYDSVLMRYTGTEAIADVPERKLYFKTKFGSKMPPLFSLFDRCKCENVPASKDDCDSEKDGGPLDQGKAFSYTGFSNSRAMLDPYWIGGNEKHARRTSVKNVVIFHKDSLGKPMEILSPDKALEVIEAGKTGMKAGGGADEMFFNPHLLVRTSERVELQKRFFKRLFNSAKVYYINAEVGRERMSEIVAELVG
jgi:hypothetical protein